MYSESRVYNGSQSGREFVFAKSACACVPDGTFHYPRLRQSIDPVRYVIHAHHFAELVRNASALAFCEVVVVSVSTTAISSSFARMLPRTHTHASTPRSPFPPLHLCARIHTCRRTQDPPPPPSPPTALLFLPKTPTPGPFPFLQNVQGRVRISRRGNMSS